MTPKKCIIIAGPTASGKTAKAIQLAKELKTEIISADSRQCFKELRIGVARPTDEQLEEVPHHFIANHSIHENVTAKTFSEEASVCLDNIFRSNDHAIVCGGTGLYIKALIEGFDDIPEIPEDIRKRVIELYKDGGIDVLRSSLLKQDPGFARYGDINNPNRMMRAFEVMLHSGKPINAFHTSKKKELNYEIAFQIIDVERPVLYNNIDQRVDQMIQHGLEDEVRSLEAFQDKNALQTVGYKEFFDYFNGLHSRETAIEKIKQHTRNYAKRQITWFKKFMPSSLA